MGDSAIHDELAEPLEALCRAAGDEILDVYHRNVEVEVDTKVDNSPLTEADLRANRVIVEGLRRLTPDWPIVSEEVGLPSYAERRQWQRYWIVDPLDGTKEFIRRSDEFTVNIALIENHYPAVGLVYVPATRVVYLGSSDNMAKKIDADGRAETISCRAVVPDRPLDVVASLNHSNAATDQLISELENHFGVTRRSIGSSLKFCLVAEGAADLYPRLGPTSEWDTAAAQAVVEAAGGAVVKEDFSRLDYNSKDSILNPHFLVVADPHFDWRSLLRL